MAAHGIITDRLAGRCATARQCTIRRTAGHVACGIVAGGIAPIGAGDAIQVVAIPIGVTTTAWSRRQLIQHIVGVALLIGRARQTPFGQSLTGWRPFGPGPGQAILLVIAEGLVVVPRLQDREGIPHVPYSIEAARLGIEIGAVADPGGADAVEPIVQIIAQAQGIRPVAFTDAGWLPIGARLAGVGHAVRQRHRRARERLARTRQPILAVVAGGDEIAIRIGRGQRLVGIIEGAAHRIRRAIDHQRPGGFAPPVVIDVTITARDGARWPADKGFTGELAQTVVAVGRAVIGVRDIGIAQVAMRAACRLAIQPIIAGIDVARRPTWIALCRKVAVGIVGVAPVPRSASLWLVLRPSML